MKKKGSKGLPAVSTASLPDVIFMILFFFMVTTSMREQEVFVQTRLPEASEVQKLEKKSLASYIYIGPPMAALRAKDGTATRIQLNDSYRTAPEIGEFIASERDKLKEDERPFMTSVLKADRFSFMGDVTDIKEELRKAEAYKISYAALPASER